LFCGSRVTRLGLRDPRLGDFGLGASSAGVPSDLAIGVTLIDQPAACLVAITQRRRKQLGAVPSRRAASNSLETLQQPDPFRLVAGFDADRLDLRPVVFEIFAKKMFLLVVKACKEQREEPAGEMLERRVMGRIIASNRCICGFCRRGIEAGHPSTQPPWGERSSVSRNATSESISERTWAPRSSA
jgi:hypothetical protein